MCVRTRGTSEKFAIFDQKLRQEVKKSVPFVRCTSCGETTIYISFLKSISFAVNNIEAAQRSRMAQLHFEIIAKRAKKGKILPKTKPLFNDKSAPLAHGDVF